MYLLVVSVLSFLQMSEKIDQLEKAALEEKPWQLSGEVAAQTRPENSMLEEDVEFDQASRMGGVPFEFCFENASDIKILGSNGLL